MFPSEHRISPPRTPPTIASETHRQPSTSPSDDSSIIELSFDYEFDSAGNYVRISKGSSRSNNSSPPTPHEVLLDGNKPSSPPSTAALTPSYAYVKPPSPILLNSPAPPRRNSLSLSSAPSDHPQSKPPTNGPSVRSFQRVASSPAALTPAQTTLRAPVSTGLRGTGRKLGRPQRIPLDDYREHQHIDERDDLLRVRGEWDSHPYEGKENVLSPDAGDGSSSDNAPRRTSPRLASRSASLSQVDGRAISSLPTRAYGSMAPSVPRPPSQSGRQIMPGPNRAGRVLMGTKYGLASSGFDKISEIDGSENEAAGEETDTGTSV